MYVGDYVNRDVKQKNMFLLRKNLVGSNNQKLPGNSRGASGWPSGLRRQTQVLVHVCGRGFKSHF